jgi:predicted CoA-binding protein
VNAAKENVVILGASDRPDRYAYRALNLLREHGHSVVLVHPRLQEIEGLPVVNSLGDVDGPVDTVTLYVNPAIGEKEAEALLALRPRRVIMNPGTESAVLRDRLTAAGIAVEEACTLVLLSTGQY